MSCSGTAIQTFEVDMNDLDHHQVPLRGAQSLPTPGAGRGAAQQNPGSWNHNLC